MVKKGRILLCGAHSVIEPLGLLHLAGLARDLEWERCMHLVHEHNFDDFFRKVDDFRPDIVGFNVYTGNHLQVFRALDQLKKDHPHIATVLGGPHPTYFPEDSSFHSDFVVMSEGFHALKTILDGTARPGILPMTQTMTFPHPDRETLYRDYPEHRDSKIKSFIGMTGCPYKCTYCYNSSDANDIVAPPNVIEQVKMGLAGGAKGGEKRIGMGGRLFPFNVRTVEDVLRECEEVAMRWPTEIFYCQDDVHGFDTNVWLPDLAKHWKNRVGLPYHAQMRWEMTAGDSGKKRLEILKDAGCFGLTLAIEAADPIIRGEVLARGMPEDIMFDGMRRLMEYGLKVRTEQITGLPYGATSRKTPINLDADLGLVELNVRLREKTGGPTMSWASTLAPYAGTKLGHYCQRFGHYTLPDNHDVPDSFFDKSVLRFPSDWIGLDLERRKDDPDVWLSPEKLDVYREQNAELRRVFNFVCSIPQGHILARRYLERGVYTFERLSIDTLNHLHSISSIDERAKNMIDQAVTFEERICQLDLSDGARSFVQSLSGYFGVLPKGNLAAERFSRYAEKKGFTAHTLSTATRHHFYDEILYSTKNGSMQNDRQEGSRQSKL